MPNRLSSLDPGYVPGMLSVYPEAADNPDTLYLAANNAESVLRQSLTYGGKVAVAADGESFPATGLLRVGPPSGQPGAAELIYYGKRTGGTFRELVRGFAGSRQNQWPVGANVTAGVTAESHNAVRDAVIQIEKNLGLKVFPAAESLNGILRSQEIRFLAPKPLFRAFPLRAAPPAKIRFQNFSGGDAIRFLWDFGDGTQSGEKSPSHVYSREGNYSVTLNVITSTGAQGIATKSNYIGVSEDNKIPLFYVTPLTGYSVQTAARRTAVGTLTTATGFLLVDQTDGPIVQRKWLYDDGERSDEDNPNVHTTKHFFQKPGLYQPSLLVVFASQQVKRLFITEKITVL